MLHDIRDNNIALFDNTGALMAAVADNNRVTGHVRGFPVSNTDTNERRFSTDDKF